MTDVDFDRGALLLFGNRRACPSLSDKALNLAAWADFQVWDDVQDPANMKAIRW